MSKNEAIVRKVTNHFIDKPWFVSAKVGSEYDVVIHIKNINRRKPTLETWLSAFRELNISYQLVENDVLNERDLFDDIWYG